MTVTYDYERVQRTGMPEAIFCEGKNIVSLVDIAEELLGRPESPLLFTRLGTEQLEAFPARIAQHIDYDMLSRTATMNGRMPKRSGSVAVVTAGTSDLSVAEEASRTLEFMGIESPVRITDVGVAGLWRLENRLNEIRACDIVIVVAGMDAALASVMGGLVEKPVIGVPTSVGYGVASDGHSALHSMLCSCAQGIVVTNIDNGFGAACAALRILNSSRDK